MGETDIKKPKGRVYKTFETLTRKDKINIAKTLLKPENMDKPVYDLVSKYIPGIKISMATLDQLWGDNEFKSIYIEVLKSNLIQQIPKILNEALSKIKEGEVKYLKSLFNVLDKMKPLEEDSNIEIVWKKPAWFEKFDEVKEEIKKELINVKEQTEIGQEGEGNEI